MSWVAVAVGGTLAASSAYSSDQSRKNVHQQQDAMIASQAADARQAAEADTQAAVAANARTADSARRRRNNALSFGDPSARLAPATGATVLGGGGIGPRPTAAGTAPYGGTALGAGAPR